LVAYAEDTKGDEIYSVHVIDAETGAPVGKPLTSVTSHVEWANDDTLVYITMDEILRPDKVLVICLNFMHRINCFNFDSRVYFKMQSQGNLIK
jgi:protease II